MEKMMPMNRVNSNGEHWTVFVKDGGAFRLIDLESCDEAKFILVHGNEELARRVAAAMNAN